MGWLRSKVKVSANTRRDGTGTTVTVRSPDRGSVNVTFTRGGGKKKKKNDSCLT